MSKSTQANRLARPAIAIAVASALAILASNAAMAQTEAAKEGPRAAEDKEPTTTVMVVGTRKSVASAIDRKIRNATVSDSIVAEDINQFPDKNVGEALSRITGVQLTRDFGEGSQVSIRGVEPDLNRIEINGMSVLGTNGNAGRGAELRELASELIASIDVYKGTTSDLTEGGVGGTVSIRTRKPLDFKEMTIAGTLAGEHSTSRGGVQPRGSLLWADKFMDGRLGIMANLVYDKVMTQNDYSRNTSWRFLRDWDGSPEKTVSSLDPAVAAIGTAAGCAASTTLNAAQKTACQQQWFDYNPGTSRYGIWTRDHKRSSAELTAQYKFSNDFNAFVSYQRNDQDQRLNDRNYGTDFNALTRLSTTGVAPVYNAATGIPNTGTGTCTALPATTTPAGMVVSNHIVTEYTVGNCQYVGGVGGQGAFSTSARDFKLKINSDYLSTGFNYKNGGLEVEGLLNTAKSKYHNETNSIILTQNAPGLKVQLDAQGLPHFTFPAGYSPDDPNSYVQAQLQYRPYETKNSEDQAKLDFKYRLTTPFFNKLWFGAQGRRADSQRYDGGGYLVSNNGTTSTTDDIYAPSANVNSTILFDPFNTTGKLRASSVPTYPNYYYNDKYVSKADMAALISAVAGRTPGTFFGGYNDVNNVPSGWMSPVYSNAVQYFDTSHFNFDSVYSATGNDGKVYPQIPTFKVKETIRAAYVRADFDTELFDRNLWGNIGVRYTGTRNTATGLNKLSVRTPTGNGTAYTDTVISNSIVSVDNKYHDYLPSANAMMWLIPDQFMLRLGWGKVMARPAIDKLVPAANCILGSGLDTVGGDGTDDCTAGNPDLKPYRATNKDLSLEYYPSADTQLTAGFFRKAIDSYIVTKALRSKVDLFHNGILFDVTGPTNGQGATTNGVELTWRQALTFLPGYARGLGLDMNYTRMNYKYAAGTALINPLDGTELTYPGLSKNSYNAAVWYDLGDINARVAYNYRDRYYTGGADVAGNPTFQQKSGYLDAKLQWRYNKNITISLEGKNLTDQAQTTDGGSALRVNEVAWAGRRYFLTLSVKN